MEFLDLPREPFVYEEARIVPLFWSWPYKYSGEPFLDYLDITGALYRNGDEPGFIHEHDVNRHYQNWLFFGLLHEFLGEHFNELDFVCWDDRHQTNRIRTTRFRSILARWQAESLDSIQQADPTFSHFRKCLDAVKKTLEETDRLFNGHSETLGLQIDVIAAIAEALTVILRDRHDNFERAEESGFRALNWFAVSYQGRPNIRQRTADLMVEEGGWCPNDIQRAHDRFRTIEAFYFLRHLDLSSGTRRHLECTNRRCEIVTSSSLLNIPRHTRPSCRCKSISISDRRLTNFHRQGHIACLRLWRKASGHRGNRSSASENCRPVGFASNHVTSKSPLSSCHSNNKEKGAVSSPTGGPALQKNYGSCLAALASTDGESQAHKLGGAESCTDGDGFEDMLECRLEAVDLTQNRIPRYFAISHVWQDGTGNAYGNCLPACQLTALFDRLEFYRDAHYPQEKDSPVLMWIDTMCCPYRQGRGKQLALSVMKDIYWNAASVHVWDNSLRSWDTDGYYLEDGARLFFSPWMRRLWTAQEAIFSGATPDGHIIIHFRNGNLDMVSIYRSFYQKHWLCTPFVRSLAEEFIWLEPSGWKGSGGVRFGGALYRAARLLQHRATSVKSDEALVLANILGLRENLIGLPHEDAMCKFWKLFEKSEDGAIPNAIIFVPTPKLKTPGFRWAPATLLDSGSHLISPYFQNNPDGEVEAEITPFGLSAQYLGFRLIPHASPQARCLLGRHRDRCGQLLEKLSLELEGGNWMFAGHQSRAADFSLESFFNMYERLRSGSLALLSMSPEISLEPVMTAAVQVLVRSDIEGIMSASLMDPLDLETPRQLPRELEKAAKECAMVTLTILDEHQVGTTFDPSDIDDTITTRWMQNVFDQQARGFLLRNPELISTTRQNCREDANAKKDWSFEQVVDEFKQRVHRHAHIGPLSILELPEDTQWYID